MCLSNIDNNRRDSTLNFSTVSIAKLHRYSDPKTGAFWRDDALWRRTGAFRKNVGYCGSCSKYCERYYIRGSFFIRKISKKRTEKICTALLFTLAVKHSKREANKSVWLVAAQFCSGQLPNYAAISARKTGAVRGDGAVWEWLLFFKRI